MLLEGVFAAITTPFYSDESVYYRKLEANVARYSRSLLSGILVLGSTGESVLLDEAESADVLRVAAEAAAPEKVLIAGVGQQSLRSTLKMAEVAARFRYDVVLVRTPTFYATQMSASAILNYFRSVADRSPLPVLLYNIPSCVHFDLPVDVVAALAQHPNIIGIKDSSGSVERLSATIAATRNVAPRTVTVTLTFQAVTARMLLPPVTAESLITIGNTATLTPSVAATAKTVLSDRNPTPANPALAKANLKQANNAVKTSTDLKTRTKEIGFQVLTGATGNILPALEAGATGAILGSASYIPQAITEIYLAWKDHDRDLANEKQGRVRAVGQRISSQLGVPGIKYACDFNGFYGGLARAPLLSITAEERSEVERLLVTLRH